MVYSPPKSSNCSKHQGKEITYNEYNNFINIFSYTVYHGLVALQDSVWGGGVISSVIETCITQFRIRFRDQVSRVSREPVGY